MRKYELLVVASKKYEGAMEVLGPVVRTMIFYISAKDKKQL